MTMSISPKNNGLNQHEKDLIYVTTKYLTLLSVAVISIVINLSFEFLVLSNIAYNDRTQFALSWSITKTKMVCLVQIANCKLQITYGNHTNRRRESAWSY